ncbi:hypothetical protein ACU8V3_16910 [Cobetia marina]
MATAIISSIKPKPPCDREPPVRLIINAPAKQRDIDHRSWLAARIEAYLDLLPRIEVECLKFSPIAIEDARGGQDHEPHVVELQLVPLHLINHACDGLFHVQLNQGICRHGRPAPPREECTGCQHPCAAAPLPLVS